MRRPSWWGTICIAITLAACSAGDNRVDPEDLELRDLLGISPEVATAWDAAQRAAARRVLVAGFRATDGPAQLAAGPGTAGIEERDGITRIPLGASPRGRRWRSPEQLRCRRGCRAC
jgi:hypothetical protein